MELYSQNKNSFNNYNNNTFLSNYISDIYYNNFKVTKYCNFGHQIMILGFSTNTLDKGKISEKIREKS